MKNFCQLKWQQNGFPICATFQHSHIKMSHQKKCTHMPTNDSTVDSHFNLPFFAQWPSPSAVSHFNGDSERDFWTASDGSSFITAPKNDDLPSAQLEKPIYMALISRPSPCHLAPCTAIRIHNTLLVSSIAVYLTKMKQNITCLKQSLARMT